MTEQQRQQDIMNYFDNKIFEPAIRIGKERNIPKVVSGVNLTRGRMSRLSSKKMIQFFWSAIIGTERSIEFSELLKDLGISRFEDVMEEVRVRFNDEYFRSEV